MKTTNTGYRITKNGNILKSIEQGAMVKASFLGESFKEEGIYYFFNRKQGNNYIYLT